MTINYKKQEEECLALSYAMKILKAGFEDRDTPKIDWILYVDWVPEVVRTLIKTNMDYRQHQIRIAVLSDATGLDIDKIRKLLKTMTMTELENFERVGWEIVFRDLVKV